MKNKKAVSLIIISKNEGHNLKQTVDHLVNHKSKITKEIIVIDDGSTDRSSFFIQQKSYNSIKFQLTKGVGPASARNLGVSNAEGEILIFLDAHVIPQENWLDNLASRFSEPNIYSVVPVLGDFNPAHPDIYGVKLDQKMQPFWVTKAVKQFSPVPFAGAGCFAIRTETYKVVDGFDNGYRGIGFSDIDFCLTLWQWGFNIYLDPELKVLHKFKKTKPYRVSSDNITYNYLRLAFKHFNENRIINVLDNAKHAQNFGKILVDILGSDVWEKRLNLQSKRRYDDEWFFNTFPQ